MEVEHCRRQFPALRRTLGGRPVVFFDGPGGSQVPQRVIDAVGGYLATSNANHAGLFATSVESDALLEDAHRTAADLVGAHDADEIVFGANMTTLCFALSRALARGWGPGDEVIVTRLDHDANVTPWVLAARDAGATVHQVRFHPEDCTLDMDDLRKKLSSRARLLAVGAASNATGAVNPVGEICRLAHEAGGLVFVDAVHFAPHRSIDVGAWQCDFLACSAYKFFGPHVGMLWGRRELLETLPAYKVRPATNELPGRWMTGTQNHEGIAGTAAAIEYLADIGRDPVSDALSRRDALVRAFDRIGTYESELTAALLDGLAEFASVRVWGITDRKRFSERVPTVSITHRRMGTEQLARLLADRGIFVWHGNYYALCLTEDLGLEPEGMVRIGLMHYNTGEEVERLLKVLGDLEN